MKEYLLQNQGFKTLSKTYKSCFHLFQKIKYMATLAEYKTFLMNKANIRKSINPAYRKHKPSREEVNHFFSELKQCIDTIKLSDEKNESEEHIKEPIKSFFHNTFYKENLINTKDRIDLAIYLGKDAKSDIGVIIEAKKPSNKAEFITESNLNKKALQELLLYYLRERLDNKNNNLKHLITTNGYEWFLFKAEDFYKHFFKNKALIKEYEQFRDGLKDTSKNELFYAEIASKYIAQVQDVLPFVHIDFSKTNFATLSDAQLNIWYKVFSNVYLLGHSFGNDSNKLNGAFYHELLHIIGLEEIKDKGKKIIDRKPEAVRDYASLLENTIFTIEDKDHLPKIKSVGNTNDKAFSAGLELCLTWINRVLFLKLLESQLLTYHKGAKEYKFLQTDFINGFDDLNDLFFSALARKTEERHAKFKERFKYIPYLNSSLFERNELEAEAFEISALKDEKMQLYPSTVLKDSNGKRMKGKIDTLSYLFQFLDAFDFATDGTEGITDDSSKTLINASVLGLIFEKINGYKDGSFYTPAFITMYMCKETLRRTVTQKFKEQINDQIETFDDVKGYLQRFFKQEDTLRFNKVINEIKICDPAVGSGHFLVSALNELIAIKNELGILADSKGFALRCEVTIINDELYITDENGDLFVYNPNDKESQRIQETLFTEKQTLIENCLFGVDINPNSVKICRLRLWIELLKNAYYKPNTNELETLPNIDINIKCGNSLISRFGLDADLKQALKESKLTIDIYKNAVNTYRNAESKEQKREMEALIEEVKNNFKSVINQNSKEIKELIKNQNEFHTKFESAQLFETTLTKAQLKYKKELAEKIKKQVTEIEIIKSNKIYENAFEWRFEFPDVLNDEGDFVGFDAVIGNPPYVQLQSMKEMSKQYEKLNFATYTSMGDLYALFYEKGNQVLRKDGILCFITGSAWMRANYGKPLRDYLNTKTSITDLIDFSDCEIFDSATVLTNILMLEKSEISTPIKAIRFTRKDQDRLPLLKEIFETEFVQIDKFPQTSWIISDKNSFDIKTKVESQGIKLINWDIKINRGILTGLNEAFIIDGKTKDELIAKDPKSTEIIKPLLRGRDVKKFYYDFDDLWLINSHNGIKEKGISPIKIEEYPAIKTFLDLHWDKLSKRTDKGDTPYNLRNCAYLEDFEKPKIIYSELTKFLNFSYDSQLKYIDKTAFILTGMDLEYLICFLNSKLFKYCFAQDFSEIQGNTRVLSKVIFEQLPIKKITTENQQPFIEKVNEILAFKQEDSKADTTALEKEIDAMVYKLYGLTDEEVKIVEES